MLTQEIFTDKKELERLRVQSRLITPYEGPAVERLLAGRQGLRVLDLGCNSGGKTHRYFSSPAVSAVLGLEFNPKLAEEAQRVYGSDIFHFFSCDCGSASSAGRIRSIMAQCGIESFDIIYLSFVLMHLPEAESVLKMLRDFLAPGGVLLIAEPHDGASVLTGEGNLLLQEFLAVLARDPYAGNRAFGAKVPELLSRCGYLPEIENEEIRALPGDTQKKQDIYTTFFTYLEDDLDLLLHSDPENSSLCRDAAWLRENLPSLRAAILSNETEITMGFRVLTAQRCENA